MMESDHAMRLKAIRAFFGGLAAIINI